MSKTLPTVLVVDDEVRSLEALRRTLDEDFTVLTADSAAAAAAILAREWVHIVLCDQRMPGVSGVEFLSEVREKWPDAVRIIISGYTDSEDIIAGINEAGIYQYLLKPWQPEQLLLILRAAARSPTEASRTPRLQRITIAPVLLPVASRTSSASSKQALASSWLRRSVWSEASKVSALARVAGRFRSREIETDSSVASIAASGFPSVQ